MNNAPVQVMQVTPTSLVIYNEYLRTSVRTEKENQNELNLTRGDFNGYISQKARRVITKRLNSWLSAIIENNKNRKLTKGTKRRKPTFITLTLPAEQDHSDKEIKRECLDKFIQRIKRVNDVKQYFWVAETQKNGNIHFHVIIDSYIPHEDIRAYWNGYLNNLGYIKRFKAKHGHNNPNSTDVHIVGGFGQAVKYVVKYVQKSKSSRAIEGRLHGISDDLKNIKAYTTTIDNLIEDFVTDAINQKESRIFMGDHFTVIYCNVRLLDSFRDSSIRKDFDSYLNDVYDYLYNDLDPFQLQVQEDVIKQVEPKTREEALKVECFIVDVQTKLFGNPQPVNKAFDKYRQNRRIKLSQSVSVAN